MKRLGFVLFILVFILSCSTIRVSYEYDPEADFSTLKTYDWLPIPKKDRGNELAIKNLKSIVNRQLEAKGFKMRSESPDVLIALHFGKERRVDTEEWGYAYRRGGPYYWGTTPYYWGPPESYEYRRGIETYEYEIGTLIIDFINPKTMELIWRGTGRSVIEPDSEKRLKDIDETVAKVLENFPPAKRRY